MFLSCLKVSKAHQVVTEFQFNVGAQRAQDFTWYLNAFLSGPDLMRSIQFLKLGRRTLEKIRKVLKECLPSPALLIAFSFASTFYLLTSPHSLVGILEIKKNHNIKKANIKANKSIS